MQMSIIICDYPLLLLDTMKQELQKYTNCEVLQLGADVQIKCTADVVKCMEVVAVADKYNFHMDEGDHELFAKIET